MESFSADDELFGKLGVQVLAVSHNDPATQHKFKVHCADPFPFLSDPDGKVARQYGVDGLFHFFSRTTFLIDAHGIVRSVVQGMPFDRNLSDTIAAWPPAERGVSASGSVRRTAIETRDAARRSDSGGTP